MRLDIEPAFGTGDAPYVTRTYTHIGPSVVSNAFPGTSGFGWLSTLSG